MKNEVSKKPLSSAVVNARLKGYMQSVNLWEGETPHGTRSVVVLTLSWLGLDKEGVKSHVGWKSDKIIIIILEGMPGFRNILMQLCCHDVNLKDKINLYRGATSSHIVVN